MVKGTAEEADYFALDPEFDGLDDEWQRTSINSQPVILYSWMRTRSFITTNLTQFMGKLVVSFFRESSSKTYGGKQQRMC